MRRPVVVVVAVLGRGDGDGADGMTVVVNTSSLVADSDATKKKGLIYPIYIVRVVNKYNFN